MADTKFTQADIDKAVADAVKAANEKADADVKGLKAKVDELLTESKDAKAAKKAAEDKAAEEARKAAEDGGDVEALKASYEAKIEKINIDHAAELSTVNTALSDATVGAQATSLAAEISVPGMERHVKGDFLARMSTDMVEGKLTVNILDKDGKPSAMTAKELQAEIASDPANKNLVVASASNGGGAPNSKGGAGGLKRSEMSAKDKNEYQNQHGQEAYLALEK